MRTDWQVSRFLKQRAKAPVLSLSRTATAQALWRPGLIRCRWAWTSNGCGHAILRRWRIHRAAPMTAMAGGARLGVRQILYRLWCTKEALIKAAGLDFPADLHAGVYRQGGYAKLPHRRPKQLAKALPACAAAGRWPVCGRIGQAPQMRWQYLALWRSRSTPFARCGIFHRNKQRQRLSDGLACRTNII